MSKIKDAIIGNERYTSDPYRDFIASPKVKKILSFHEQQMNIISDAIRRPSFMKPEGNWFDER